MPAVPPEVEATYGQSPDSPRERLFFVFLLDVYLSYGQNSLKEAL